MTAVAPLPVDRYPRHDEQVRQRLQDAAIACLREQGFNKVTMRHIGERAGLVRQTVYNYYRSKHEVLAAAFMREGMALAQDVARHIRQIEGVDNRFVEGFLYVVEQFPRNPVLALVLEPGSDFLARVGMSYWPFSEIGRVTFAEIFQQHPALAAQAEEISEHWSRNAMSFLTLRGPTERSREELAAYVRRRLLPGLGLQDFC